MNVTLPGLASDEDLACKLAQALVAKGDGYRPRAEHLTDLGSPQYTNRLILESSPYLLQHAHNPVNWSSWSNESFERAKAESKLVLLSVGYSTCHWCHVMERESFEDLEIAAFINAHFVAIKVDREERPDVDGVYMTAVQLMTGRGGWPMTVVLTPEGEPIFGGTYFPARDGDRGASTGFLSILKMLNDEWRAAPEKIIQAAMTAATHIRRATGGGSPGGIPDASAINKAVSHLQQTFDADHGGFGPAPKFPRSSNLDLLMRAYRRTKNPAQLRAVELTLEKMAAGGIHDQIGGGFHRYSVDDEWLVPHFEKMLYDNGQLAVTYLEAHQLTGREDFAAVVRKTLDYVTREMTHEQGGFFSATDADSPGSSGEAEEGLFFTWTPGEMEQVLGAERARWTAAYYRVSTIGNFEGRNVLHTEWSVEDTAASLKMSTAEFEAELESTQQLLYAARSQRPRPLRDDKILTSWNGLMISAFARAGQVLNEPSYLDTGSRAAQFIIDVALVNGRLARTWTDGSTRVSGYLDDYAFFIQALIDLYEASGRPLWLQHALVLQKTLDEHFGDEQRGGYFFTSDEHPTLLAREKPEYDGAEPAGASIAALNLLRLEQLTSDERFRKCAEQIFVAHAGALSSGVALPKMLTALDYYLDEPAQVVIVGPEDGSGVEALLTTLNGIFLPNRVISIGREGKQLAEQARLLPLLQDKRALNGTATAYVCRGTVCAPPTSDCEVFAKELARTAPR